MTRKSDSTEGERLRELRSYDVLDTPRESEFDDIVDHVAEVCDVPVALISLVDRDRQWFKAEHGLGQRETPLDRSICARVLDDSDYVEIPDTLADPRSRDNPLCQGVDGFRFYAGAILYGDGGLPLGSLCVLDRRSRALTPLQRRTIRLMARLVMQQLGLRRTVRTADLLAAEIDHRVKNSLQMVTSLLRVQKRTFRGSAAEGAFAAAENRIAAVARLHEALHRSSRVHEVDLPGFLERIVSDLRGSIRQGIALDAALEPAEVGSHMASAIAMIATEFVMNASKYAFPAGRGGRVLISGKSVEEGGYRITFEDDGIGVDPDAQPTGTGLGMRIMEASARQLGSQLEIPERRCGFAVAVEFVLSRTDRAVPAV